MRGVRGAGEDLTEMIDKEKTETQRVSMENSIGLR